MQTCSYIQTHHEIVNGGLWLSQEAGFFPKADTNWDSFHEVQKLVLKNAGRV